MAFIKDPAYLAAAAGTLNNMAWAPVRPMGDIAAPMTQYQQTVEAKQKEAAAKAEALAMQTKTAQFVQAMDPELGAAIQSGAISAPDAYKMIVQRRTEAAKPRPWKDDYLTVGKQVLKRDAAGNLVPAYTPPGGVDGDTEFGLAPVYGQDESGNLVIYQLGKDGKVNKPQFPAGFKPLPGTKTVDQGTNTGVIDTRTGQLITTYDKNIPETEAQKTQGKLTGEARQALPATLAKADNAIATIDKAIAHKGRETSTGLSSIIDPRNYIPGTDSADFQEVNKQLQGQAFLEAFSALKGGGQITEIEGAKATAAMARLSTSQSDEEYKQALLELRDIVANGRARAAQAAGEVPQQTNAGTTKSGLKFKVLP